MYIHNTTNITVVIMQTQRNANGGKDIYVTLSVPP